MVRLTSICRAIQQHIVFLFFFLASQRQGLKRIFRNNGLWSIFAKRRLLAKGCTKGFIARVILGTRHTSRVDKFYLQQGVYYERFACSSTKLFAKGNEKFEWSLIVGARRHLQWEKEKYFISLKPPPIATTAAPWMNAFEMFSNSFVWSVSVQCMRVDIKVAKSCPSIACVCKVWNAYAMLMHSS